MLKHFGPDAMLAPGWPTAGRPLTSGQTDAVHPLASADSAGGMALAWTTASPGASQLRLLLLDASGTASSGWAEGGGIIGASTGLLLPAALSATPNGLHLAWSELFQDSVAARVVRVERDGVLSTGWTPGGLALASTEHVSQPALQEDGLGGAYVAWIGTPVAGTRAGVHLTRLNAAGTASAGWPAEGILVAASRPDSYRPRLLRAEDGVLVSWSESESRSEGTLLNAAMAALGSLPELERVEPWPDLVRVAWRTNGDARYDVLVERQESSGEWAPLHELNRDATGALKLEDREVSAGSIVSYRLRLRSPELELVTAEVRVEVPAAAPLALRGLAIQNGRLRLAATVSSRSESRFELFDVQGRRLLRDVRTHEHAGEVALDWPVPDGVRAGVFFARLSQGRELKTRRFVLGR
jgi:hypothetical protein